MLTHQVIAARRTLDERALFLLLFLGALLPLFIGLETHPPFLYNWEEYTVWQLEPARQAPWTFLLQSLHVTDGLMTDSGLTPVVLLPALLLGPAGDLWSLRFSTAACSAFAVPLLYLVGRETYGRRVGLLAAGLLGTSACFAFYARTATNVGLSLAPALLSIWLLLRWRKGPTLALSAALGLLFVAEAYYYATIRFLFPLAVAYALVYAWRWRPTHTLYHLAALAVPLLVFLTLQRPTAPLVLGSLLAYYHGRGEQLVSMLGEGAATTATALVQRGLEHEPWLPAGLDRNLAAALLLLKKNVSDTLNLLTNYGTSPVALDFWNPRGRLYDPYLVPFFLLGLTLGWRERRRAGSGIVLFLLAGTTLPLLLTNNVHVGRLLLALPLVLLLAARGLDSCLTTLATGWRQGVWRDGKLAMAVALGLLALYWGLVRPQPPRADVGLWLLAVGLGTLALPLGLRARAGYAGGLVAVTVVLGAGALGEWSLPLPVHHPYAVAQALRALPEGSDVLFVSHRPSGDMAQMEASCLQFYLRDRYEIVFGTPGGPDARSTPRLHVIAGDAAGLAGLPATIPDSLLLVADGALSADVQAELRQRGTDRLLVVP